MSLARAFTKRIKRDEAPPSTPKANMARANSTRQPGKPFDRSLISAPTALLSTTNMITYTAPDIVPLRLPSGSSASSIDSPSSDSDASTQSMKSRDTLTDASSIDDHSPSSPSPNHLSGFFKSAQAEQQLLAQQPVQQKDTTISNAPAVPQRALSHSKSSHMLLAKKRSLQNMQPPATSKYPLDVVPEREQRTSTEIFRPSELENPVEAHPFGRELEQLSEVAEEFVNMQEDEDTRVMKTNGLVKFCANEYITEISDLMQSFLPEHQMQPVAWI
ncbi:hypothetical protein K402DRAFT_342395 [Aulographum hederae CBS 113979]|uniref:Uncharacterized protein n=1 Tax=Aulographum hederae CBS 113979 TaxID=1176131 RepID=A0A6G1GKK7_9PEZI|nr:hypothetical protein K402DRAFT_342395 [Aulographum hederae CBS 113979]